MILGFGCKIGRWWLYLLYPENEGHDVIGEILSVTEGFEFLVNDISIAVSVGEKQSTHIGLYNRSTAGEKEWSAESDRLPDPAGSDGATNFAELGPE